MAVVKTSISLQEDVYKFGSDRADRLFGGKFSGYINYLISQDREQRQEPEQNQNNKVLSAIEQILEL